MNHAVLMRESGDSAIFAVQPALASGAPATKFLIEITRVGETVKAREVKPDRLPSFCPERHINFDGSFCLFWAELERHTIDNHEAAAGWWGKLLIFLLRQGTAAVLRSWPGKADARAHGPEAARFQAVAEFNASNLGKAFISSLREERFSTVEKRVNNERRVRLLLNGKRILSVVRNDRRVMTLRQRCKCGDGNRPISACSDHADVLADFALALDGWREAEQSFFYSFKNTTLKCCGTMDSCPLADFLAVQLDEAA
ncbi:MULTISPECIES: E2 domain-associated cysteine-rich protein [Mesorhizobium]|uniref:E2 domain-associated cysteine-rich protein n=1 Tax=Mesorhizobium TaxID=68287 RepID=UPI0012EB299F|nr:MULTISPECIES: E2 domain-associated cysteine-rich protein [Mesorhizobium]WJI38400.1 hypothetical protein NL534_32165 [Mesorhizobium opportunistum]